MNSRRPIRRWTARISWAWLIAIVTTWLLLITTSESFLPATLLAYGPRFLLLLPFLPLLMVSAIAARKSLLPLSLAMLIVLGPIMGGRVSWRTIGRGIPPTVAPGMLRILTYNTEGGRLVASRLREVIRDLKPDILAFQECGDILWDSVRVLAEYHTARYANLCTGSRWPITSSDTMPRADFARIATYGYGGTGLVHRLILASPYGPLVFVNLHLETARRGLEALIGDDGLVPDRIDRRRSKPPDQRGSAMERIRLNAEIRDRESERASVWSSRGDKSIPLVVTGDFNLPVESTIFRRHWEGFTDSFESAGSGFGWSRREGRLLRIRIDHVLTNGSALQPIGSWIGPDFGSDHLPVIADLFWRHR